MSTEKNDNASSDSDEVTDSSQSSGVLNKFRSSFSKYSEDAKRRAEQYASESRQETQGKQETAPQPVKADESPKRSWSQRLLPGYVATSADGSRSYLLLKRDSIPHHMLAGFLASLPLNFMFCTYTSFRLLSSASRAANSVTTAEASRPANLTTAFAQGTKLWVPVSAAISLYYGLEGFFRLNPFITRISTPPPQTDSPTTVTRVPGGPISPSAKILAGSLSSGIVSSAVALYMRQFQPSVMLPARFVPSAVLAGAIFGIFMPDSRALPFIRFYTELK